MYNEVESSTNNNSLISNEIIDETRLENKNLAPDITSKVKKRPGRPARKATKKPALKKCQCCGKELPIEEFNYWNKEKGSRMSICKECEHEKQRLKREYKKNLLLELKEVGCCICGESDPVCLDFHHYDQSEKEFNVSLALTKTVPDMIEEASKCVIVCSNCHRKIHAGTLNIEDYLPRHEYDYRRKLFTLYQASLKRNDWVHFPHTEAKTKKEDNKA